MKVIKIVTSIEVTRSSFRSRSYQNELWKISE